MMVNRGEGIMRLKQDKMYEEGWDLTFLTDRVTLVRLPKKVTKPLTHHEVLHDKEGLLWCGPAVISALTGVSTYDITELIKKHRKNPAALVRGTNPEELEYVLVKLKHAMECQAIYGGKVENRPTLGRWLKEKGRQPGLGYIVHISGQPDDPGGHWCVVLDDQFFDSFTKVWVHIDKAPHRRCRVNCVFTVRKKR